MKPPRKPDDFEDITAAQNSRARAEDARAHGDETAGRETGRQKRFLPGEASPEARKKRERDANRQFATALDRLLQDPVYRARYEAFGSFLTTARSRTDDLLDQAQTALGDIRGALDDMLNRANRLPDGRRVFRRADGSVIDENGEPVSDEDAASVVWKDGAPTAEDYLEARRKEQEAVAHLHELQQLQAELGGISDRYDDPDNPLSIEEMDHYENEIEEHLADVSNPADWKPSAEPPSVPGAPAIASVAKPIL